MILEYLFQQGKLKICRSADGWIIEAFGKISWRTRAKELWLSQSWSFLRCRGMEERFPKLPFINVMGMGLLMEKENPVNSPVDMIVVPIALLHGLIHPRWCRISSIDRMILKILWVNLSIFQPPPNLWTKKRRYFEIIPITDVREIYHVALTSDMISPLMRPVSKVVMELHPKDLSWGTRTHTQTQLYLDKLFRNSHLPTGRVRSFSEPSFPETFDCGLID